MSTNPSRQLTIYRVLSMEMFCGCRIEAYEGKNVFFQSKDTALNYAHSEARRIFANTDSDISEFHENIDGNYFWPDSSYTNWGQYVKIYTETLNFDSEIIMQFGISDMDGSH